MASEELLNSFEDREMETLEIFMTANAERASITIEEFIEARLLQGASPESIRSALLTDLNEGGRIFSEFRSAIRSTARGSINRIRDAGVYSETGIIEKFRWTAVLVKTCPDCLQNHGKVMAWEKWESSRFGLPRSNGTVCRQNCHCMLLPASTTELEPIMRVKK